MSKIAVDVVLLLPKEVIDLSIAANQTLNPKPDKIILGREVCIPHISLCMGVMDRADEKRVEETLNGIARSVKSLDLQISELAVLERPKGNITSGFSIERTNELQSVHEAVMNELESIISNDVEPEMFSHMPDSYTLEYVRKYREQKSYKNFHPHITLGKAPIRMDLKLPIAFTVDTLALCYTGSYGTCAHILFSAKLGSKQHSHILKNVRML